MSVSKKKLDIVASAAIRDANGKRIDTTYLKTNSPRVNSLNNQTGALSLKTVNNESLLGSGNITIQGGGADYATKEEIDAMFE